MKIMITEDDAGIQDMLKMIFERVGYEVILESDGNQILNDTYQRPDFFILDKQLSGSSG